MDQVPAREAHRTLYRSDACYAAHPHAVALAPEVWLLVFNRARRRAMVLHPPQDPDFQNVLMRSEDAGAAWSSPRAVPGESWRGTECAGLTVLASGRVLLNQWRFRWYDLPLPESAAAEPGLMSGKALYDAIAQSPDLDLPAHLDASAEELLPWARGGGETWVHISDDAGRTFERSVRLDTAPYDGGYGMRGGVELGDGEILLPLSDVPHYRKVFLVRSRDGGEAWSRPEPVAKADDRCFEEPAPLLLADGRLLIALRENVTRELHTCASDDGGISWSRPRATGIRAYPAQLYQLADGRVACLTSSRDRGPAIRIHFSADGGETWETETPVTVRDKLPNKDLGYATGILVEDDDLFAIYYGQDRHGVTGIEATRLRLQN